MAATLYGMTWWDYVRTIAGTDKQTAIAEKTGIAQATISRWKLKRQSVDAPNAVAVARAFGRPPTEALVVAGFLTEEEAGARVTIQRFEEPSDERLLELIANRFNRDREEVRVDAEQPAAKKRAGGSPVDDVSVGDYTLAAHEDDQLVDELEAQEDQP